MPNDPDPLRDVVFILRTGALFPVYRTFSLLEQLKGRVHVPTVLFYPGDLDGAIHEMIGVNKPVIFDCVVDPNENCFPMIPSGRAHNEMLLGGAAEDIEEAITEAGKVMV